MNDIVYPMKVLAVKLEYRRQKLEKMVHGYFRHVNGVQNVIVTYDPNFPHYDKSHPRRLVASSRLGKIYTERINEYQIVKSEYDTLLKSWNATYTKAPPKVIFPISQFFDPHCMNNEFFNRQVDCTGKYKSDNPTVSEHGELKSKNEQIAADLLRQMDIPFKYETSVYLDAIKETINPDYLVNFYEIDRCAYLEILGMNDKIDYSLKTTTKIYGFSSQLYRPGREIIYIHLYDRYNFDEEYFVAQVMSAFDSMIPDSALIWEADSRAV